MAALSGKFTVTLKYGKDLAEKDIGKQDPYCKIHIGEGKGEKYKSKVHKKAGKSPVWDQSFMFNLKGVKLNETFHLSCWDEDLLSDDMIGRADVTLEFLLSKRGNKPFEIQIVDKDNFKKIAGYIGMTCEFEGTGAPPLESEKKEPEKKTTPTPTTPTPTTPTPTPTTAPPPTSVSPPPQSYQQNYQQQPQSYQQQPQSYQQQPQSYQQQQPQPTYQYGQVPTQQQPMMQPVLQQPVLIQQPTFTAPPIFTATPTYGFQPTFVQPVYTQTLGQPVILTQQPGFYTQPGYQPTQPQYGQPQFGQPGYPG